MDRATPRLPPPTPQGPRHGRAVGLVGPALLASLSLTGCDGEPDGQRVRVHNHTGQAIALEWDEVVDGAWVDYDQRRSLPAGARTIIHPHLFLYDAEVLIDYDGRERVYDIDCQLGTQDIHGRVHDFPPIANG